MTRSSPFNAPRSGVDLWSDEVLLDPYPAYAGLRELGPAVWLERYPLVAVPRCSDVRAVLTDWPTFSSAHGTGVEVGFNETQPRTS